MNLTKLTRRIVRETDVLVNGTTLVISLEPGGQIGLKVKGTRHTMFMPIANLYTYMSKAHPKEAAKVKPVEVKVPSALEAAIQLIKESDEPIHMKTLEKLVSGEISPDNLKKMLHILQKEHILEHVAPFHIQAVKDNNPNLTAV